MILIRHGQSHFNVVFSETRVDPGIVDPGLTEEGQRQAGAAAQALADHDVRRILASPYSRTLHTAEIIAEYLGLSVVIEPLVRERCFFTCDLGSPRSELSARWPGFEFGELAELEAGPASSASWPSAGGRSRRKPKRSCRPAAPPSVR